jgi:hypothetical protein
LRRKTVVNSEVSRIREEIALEYQAAKQGLSGLSNGSARHDFIQSKTGNIGKCHEKLLELVGPEEAISIVANTIWSPADQGRVSAEPHMRERPASSRKHDHPVF